MDHLNAAEDAEFTEFYETFYAQQCRALYRRGLRPKDLKKMIEAYFGPVPKGQRHPAPNHRRTVQNDRGPGHHLG